MPDPTVPTRRPTSDAYGNARMLSRLETPDSSSVSRQSPGDAGLSSALGIRRVGDVNSNHHLPAASPVHGLVAACSRSGLKRSHNVSFGTTIEGPSCLPPKRNSLPRGPSLSGNLKVATFFRPRPGWGSGPDIPSANAELSQVCACVFPLR